MQCICLMYITFYQNGKVIKDLLTVSNKFEFPKPLLTLKRRHFLYSAVMTFHFRFQYLPSKIIAFRMKQ